MARSTELLRRSRGEGGGGQLPLRDRRRPKNRRRPETTTSRGNIGVPSAGRHDAGRVSSNPCYIPEQCQVTEGSRDLSASASNFNEILGDEGGTYRNGLGSAGFSGNNAIF